MNDKCSVPRMWWPMTVLAWALARGRISQIWGKYSNGNSDNYIEECQSSSGDRQYLDYWLTNEVQGNHAVEIFYYLTSGRIRNVIISGEMDNEGQKTHCIRCNLLPFVEKDMMYGLCTGRIHIGCTTRPLNYTQQTITGLHHCCQCI